MRRSEQLNAEALQEIYFDVMCAHYTHMLRQMRLRSIQCSTTLDYKRGEFKLIVRSKHEKRIHMMEDIVLLRQSTPVWSMHCEGYCDKDALPHLMYSLHRQHCYGSEFNGGRGPREWQCASHGIRYWNEPVGTFAEFSGCDGLQYPVATEPSGQFQYSGGLQHTN